MATRRKLNIPPQDSLEDLVIAYADAKAELDPLKKLVDDYGTRIKENMINKDLSEITVGSVRASISISQREDFNELQAIEILRKNLPPELFGEAVKTKEYLDDSALEALIYANKIEAAILNPCRTPKKPVVTLRLGQPRKGK